MALNKILLLLLTLAKVSADKGMCIAFLYKQSKNYFSSAERDGPLTTSINLPQAFNNTIRLLEFILLANGLNIDSDFSSAVKIMIFQAFEIL